MWLSLLLVKLWTFRSVSEAATGGILLEKVFLGLRPATLFKKRLRHRCFSVNFVKFLRTPFSQNTSEGLFLVYLEIYQNMTDGKFCENRFSIFPDLSIIDISQRFLHAPLTLREKYPNTELFLVRIFVYSDWVFGLNTEIYGVNLCIQSEYRKIRTRNNPLFRHFSRSVSPQVCIFTKIQFRWE